VTQTTNLLPILLIDGNNLAHFLYPNLNSGQKMTPVDSLLLINHLNNYARQFGQSVKIELCLDRSPGDPGSLSENIRVLWAHYPQNGDDLLVDRFWFHHVSRRPCLVITNDEDILYEVNDAGGRSLRVFEFVRRPGLNSPVFREPDDLPQISAPAPGEDESTHGLPLSASIYFRLVEDPRIHNPSEPPGVRQAENPPTYTPPGQSTISYSERDQNTPGEVEYRGSSEIPAKECEAYPLTGVESGGNDGMHWTDQDVEPHYYLDLDQWLLDDGIRFLVQSFCPTHRAEYQDLIDLVNTEKAAADDLRALADLLLYTCSHEDNFARQGSLMARVRLALLQARGEPVSLTALADATGLKRHGLHGRIKAKAGRWVAIIS